MFSRRQPEKRFERKRLGRILMLVPHEPEADPRIRWVTRLCQDIGRTEIIGAVCLPFGAQTYSKPMREYAGAISVDRIKIFDYSSWFWRFILRVAWSPTLAGFMQRFIECQRAEYESVNRLEKSDGGAVPVRIVSRRIGRGVGGAIYGLAGLAYCQVLASALYRRARTGSIPPRVVICHDVFALLAAVKLKRLHGCRVIYDAHEFWPEADVVAPPWQRRVMSRIERRVIHQADVVVTVNPPLAQYLERHYGLEGVVSAPNAEPFVNREPPVDRSGSRPLRFLFQGGAAPGRGIEELLNAWRHVRKEEAVLYVRCPNNEYLASVMSRHRTLIDERRVVLLDPVTESELIDAARFADVGVISYKGPNPNHLLCCPNKLSQYMQAGLAVVSNNLTFVADVIRRYRCGVVYDAAAPETFLRAVEFLLTHPERLFEMRRAAYEAARREFNWETQSLAYKTAIERCFRESADPGAALPRPSFGKDLNGQAVLEAAAR